MGSSLLSEGDFRPLFCVWEITRACDLACRHCGSSAGAKRTDELDTGRCLEVVHELAALGNRVLSLSGGEPTLRRDWHVIAREAVECGILVNIVTNGQRDPERLADLVEKCGLANVGVSLDGLETTHDAIRSPGSFARVTRTIRVLADRGIWVDVMHTATRRSLIELAELCELAHGLGARALRVQLAKPMGNLLRGDDLLLRPADLLRFMPLLGDLALHAPIEVRVGDSVGYYSPQEKWLRSRSSFDGMWTGCKAGMYALGIQSDGGVKGCLSLQPGHGAADPFVEGSLREESLSAIWNRPGAFAYNRSFDASSLRGACGRCSHARMCRGGARCVAHAVHGDFSCDPMCYAAVATKALGARAVLRPMVPIASSLLVLTACGQVQSDYGADAPPYQPWDSGATDAPGDVTQDGSAGSGGGGAGGSAGGGADAATDGPGPEDAAADSSPDASLDAGADASADAMDCSTVCCECDYGILPPEVAEACCGELDASSQD